ncbi:MAG: bifunctional UDP-N-acetylglucosamine diphosphorylase/glucosamine-1-phosphate N-acetyltransferase GlmU [Candidatus Melainabacteria bacterium]|nr:MAG: bifunctional UDP-N-acetylglucosamine diphosphorylase/glucosamine-1-phosphate N-acetyltransferase GlmU [Candidatus Melainabacteria bacterium]
MDIKAVILAAGKGTRMKSETTPKVLHQIMGKTLLGYVLDNVKNFVSEEYVIVGHHAQEVENFVKSNYENAKTVLQSPQLGTGHAVSMVCPDLQNYDGLVLILCGDTPLVQEETLKKFVEYHKSQNSDITVMSTLFDNPTGYGRIIREQDNSLQCIVEEKDANPEQKAVKEVNAGIYCLNWGKIKDAFGQLKSNNAQGEYYLTDIISWGKTKALKVNAYILENSDEIYGINSRLNLAQAAKMMNHRNLERYMINGVTIVDPDSTWISEDTEIGQDSIVYPFTYIEGKNTIGKSCKIGPCAHFRGNVEVCDNVKVGNFVEVKKAKISSNTNVGHLSYIGDSELGEYVNIGAGTITANYNPLTKEKTKTILKDNVKIGSNTVLVAPVTVDEGANIGAGTVVTKDIPAWALGITRSPLKILENWVKKKLSK